MVLTLTLIGAAATERVWGLTLTLNRIGVAATESAGLVWQLLNDGVPPPTHDLLPPRSCSVSLLASSQTSCA